MRRWAIPLTVTMAATVAGCDRGGDAGDSAPRPNASAASAASAATFERGRSLYAVHCLACHQADGGGVPFMQPPLDGSSLLAGDPGPVVDVILRGIGGGGEALPGSGEWSQAMGAYAFLPDADIAAVATYIRGAWSNAGSAVDAALVSARRAAAASG